MNEISDEKKHAYCKKAIAHETDARLLYLGMGEMLYNIRENRLYEPFWDSWHTYTMEFKDGF